MTIQESARRLRLELQTIYEEQEAANIADWVIEYISGAKKKERLFNQKEFTETQNAQLSEYTQRLLKHEPVHYVLNEAWFCGLRFYVDKNVLIPRPETEELVEWIIASCKFPIDTLKILDVGSGSGSIAISLKKKLRKADVWSCDISEAALNVAKHNANNLGIDVRFLLLDFLNKEERDQLPSFDIIVSNPPYVPEKDKGRMSQNVLKYEPLTALFVPDDNALIFYQAIADFGKEKLNKEGSIYVEINEHLGEDVKNIFISKEYKTVELKKDMQGKDRMIKAAIVYSL